MPGSLRARKPQRPVDVRFITSIGPRVRVTPSASHQRQYDPSWSDTTRPSPRACRSLSSPIPVCPRLRRRSPQARGDARAASNLPAHAADAQAPLEGAREPELGRARVRARPLPPRDPRDLVAGLEQRHLDLIGLGLIAAAVYLGCVLYVGWDGGPVGGWLNRASRRVRARSPTSCPIAAGRLGRWPDRPAADRGAGALNAGRDPGRSPRCCWPSPPQTAGLGPEHPVRHEYFAAALLRRSTAACWARGSTGRRPRCSSALGAHILAVLMFVSGLLLTGTTVSQPVSRGPGRRSRTAGTGTRELAKTVR